MRSGRRFLQRKCAFVRVAYRNVLVQLLLLYLIFSINLLMRGYINFRLNLIVVCWFLVMYRTCSPLLKLLLYRRTLRRIQRPATTIVVFPYLQLYLKFLKEIFHVECRSFRELLTTSLVSNKVSLLFHMFFRCEIGDKLLSWFEFLCIHKLPWH